MVTIDMKTDKEVNKEASVSRLVNIISKSESPDTVKRESRDANTGELIPNIVWANIELDAEHNQASGVLHQAIHVNVEQFEHLVDITTKPYVKHKEAE